MHYLLRGGSAATNGPDIQARLDELQAEVEYLENLEKKVDEHRAKVLQSLRNVQEDPDNEQFSYIAHQDLVKVFQDRTMLVIHAPEGTQLDAPIPDNGMDQSTHSLFAMKRSYRPTPEFQIHLKSPSTAIDVLLINPNDLQSKARILPTGQPTFEGRRSRMGMRNFRVSYWMNFAVRYHLFYFFRWHFPIKPSFASEPPPVREGFQLQSGRKRRTIRPIWAALMEFCFIVCKYILLRN